MQIRVEPAAVLAPGQALLELDLLTASSEDVWSENQLEFVPVRDGVSAAGFNPPMGFGAGRFAVNANAANGLGGYGPAAGTGGYIAGVNAPPYGYPITGTPIGLPGPPHIPLGGPAGLQKHVIRNHTHSYVPDPTRKVKIHVKQFPGIQYPAPANRAWIKEYNHPQ